MADPYALKLREDPYRRVFLLFIIIHVAFWVLLPYFCRGIPHYDSTEALAWGLTWEWGTNKHPPLSGWLAEIFFRLLGDLGVYLLGQLCVAAAFIYVRRLALVYLEPASALFAALFLEGTIYYNLSAVQYNVNVLSLALAPALIYYFWRAARTGRPIFWLAAGILAGLALLTKYTNVFFILALGLWLAAAPEGRRRLMTPGPWLAVLAATLVFLPHLAWLARYDFLPLGYSQEKSAGVFNGFLREPFRILAAQAGNAAASLGLWAWLYARTPAADRGPKRRPETFLLCAGLLPLALFLAAISLMGLKGSTKWAYAFLGCGPLLLLYCLPVSAPPKVRRQALILTYAVLAAFGAGVAVKNLAFTEATTNVDGRALGAAIQAEWPKPLLYVGGHTHLVSRLSSYLPERPRPVWAMDLRVTPWEEEERIKKAGVLALALSESEYQGYRDLWPGLPPPRRLDWTFRAPLSRKEKTMIIYHGFFSND